MASGNTNFGNDQGTGTVGADGFLGPIDGAVGTTTPALGTFTYAAQSVGAALTAAGTNRATALVLAAAINNITTAASGTGALLPDVAIGNAIVVFNAGANAAQIYATGSQTIDGVAGSTGVPLTNAKRAIFYRLSSTAWVSAQLGVVSA